MPVEVASILGVITALVCTILSVILITPEKRRPTLNKFFQVIHDIFNFKFLIVEKILKFVYIFATLFCIAGGFFMLFAGYDSYFGGFQSLALSGLLTMIIGPIVVRIAYEFVMMAILVVKNVIELNNKTKNQNEGAVKTDMFAQPDYMNMAAPKAAPTYTAPVAEEWTFCTQCGTKYDKSKGACPNCQAR